jgi:hypothetical protein
MSRRIPLFLAAALVAATSAGADKKPAVPLPPVANTAFKPGEKLEFVIKYEFVAGGTATMEVGEGPAIGGHQTITIQSRAESNNFIDAFFKVRDFNGSAIDKESLASLHFHQNLQEGNYRVVRNTGIDYNEGTYNWEKISKGKTRQRSGKIDQPVQDILSAFFKTRTLPLEPGKEYAVTVFSDEEVYPLSIKVSDKTESVRVPAGKFDCLRIEPNIKGDAIFKAREGRMTIWLTNDTRRMPVLIRSRVAVGSFDAELIKYRN